jgi:uncharacterized protein (DUF1697 family)
MATWIVLLRGVNVGGANKLPMAGLRKIVADLGHGDVATYIQSGNAVMTSPRTGRTALADEICAAIKSEYGLSVSAVLRSPKELQAAIAANPFPDAEEPGRVLITFLSEKPTRQAVSGLERDRFAPDRFEIIGSDLYGFYANGSGRSKMTLDYFEKRLHVKGTSRNLNTVAKLIELANG